MKCCKEPLRRNNSDRNERMRPEPVPELCPLTREDLSEDVIEMLMDLFASPSSEHRQDSRVLEADSCVHAGSRSCQTVEATCGSVTAKLTREDGDAFTAAKQKECAPLLDKKTVELVKDRLKVPRSHILRARWVLTWKNVGTQKVPKARLCALGFQDPRLTTLPTTSPTLTSDSESTIFTCWKVES